jgi:hypothetical protein
MLVVEGSPQDYVAIWEGFSGGHFFADNPCVPVCLCPTELRKSQEE